MALLVRRRPPRAVLGNVSGSAVEDPRLVHDVHVAVDAAERELELRPVRDRVRRQDVVQGFPAALRIDAYSQASCTIRSPHAALPTGLALLGDEEAGISLPKPAPT